MVCCFLHPVRDVSIGRRNGIQQRTLHPVRDASLTGCRQDSSFAFSTERCIPNGIQFRKSKPLKLFISHSSGLLRPARNDVWA